MCACNERWDGNFDSNLWNDFLFPKEMAFLPCQSNKCANKQVVHAAVAAAATARIDR
jgi:hypothetical protein